MTGQEAALAAAVLEIDRHLAGAGWDQPARLFALVRTEDLIAAEPELAAGLGLRSLAEGALPDALTAVDQDDFTATDDLLADLAAVAWPATVAGCALSVERTFLPSSVEADIPEDDQAAAAFVAGHPAREDVRLVVGVDRAGHRRGLARLASRPDDLLAADDLVPGLASALAHTLDRDDEAGAAESGDRTEPRRQSE